MGPGGAVWGEKTEYKKSRETVPLRHRQRGMTILFIKGTVSNLHLKFPAPKQHLV